MLYKTDDELRDILREECRKENSQKAWAVKNELSAAYVCEVLRGKPISDKMANKLGYRKVYTKNY